jgi:hypothetical protein
MKNNISAWKKKTDKVFSKFIRNRDAEFGGNCISCGRWFKYEDLDAGHFVSRNCIELRYDEENVNAQCQHCNRFKSGEQARAGIGIDCKYGEGTSKKLLAIEDKYKAGNKKYPIEFYKEIYEKYK